MGVVRRAYSYGRVQEGIHLRGGVRRADNYGKVENVVESWEG